MKKSLIHAGSCLAFALLATTFLATAAQAQMSRVAINIIDTAEKALPGATIEITCKELSFEETHETDKRGRVKVAFLDGTVPYELKISKEGYQSLTVRLKPQVGLSMTRFYTIKTLEEARAEGTVQQGPAPEASNEPTRRYTPAQLSFNEGVEALKVNDFDTAEQKFLSALAQDSNLLVVHSALASVYIEKGDAEKALASAQAFAAAEPENPRSYRLLYEANKLKGDDAAAKDALEKMSSVAGGEQAAALRYNEGAAALRDGDYAKAKSLLEEALAANPDLMEAVKALAILSINQKDFARAAQLADQYLAARPNEKDITLMKIRWQSYSALGNTEKATEAFEAVKAVDPSVIIKDLVEAAQIEFNNGQTEAAVARLEQVLTINPDEPRTHYLLGLCRINQGNNDEAKRLLERFLVLAPKDPQAQEAKDMLQYIK